jgi:hypothetical protein
MRLLMLLAFANCVERDNLTSPEPEVLAYAKADQGGNTACYAARSEGVCWDLAACAVSSRLHVVPWYCRKGSGGGGLCGSEAGDDYKARPECYVWGTEVVPPSGSWDNIWNRADETFVKHNVRPGDVLQFDNYTARCGQQIWESTAGGPHTAIISQVGSKNLTVCQQHWNGDFDGACGYVFFGWFEACASYTYSFDALKIYRPGPSMTGRDSKCQTCRDLLLPNSWLPFADVAPDAEALPGEVSHG